MCERQPSTPDPKKVQQKLACAQRERGDLGGAHPARPDENFAIREVPTNLEWPFSVFLENSDRSVSHIIQLSENSRFPVKTK